jgi:serine/threonine-protein kinase
MSASPAWAPVIGTLVGERYRLTRLLGMGGMGCIFEASHVLLAERVAIKILSPERREPEGVARFFREAKAAASLHNEHVVRVVDFGEAEDVGPFLVMECLEGEDLAQLLAREGPLSVRQAVGFVLQTCAALAEAHAVGIVHRDVKPSNLFAARTRAGRTVLKVLDFGISKVTPQEGASVTTTHSTLGTPAYMAPEQVRSTKSADHRADVWSLGVVLYELLTRALPFVGATAAEMLAAVFMDPPIPPREFRPDLAPALEAIILRCLEKDRNARFQSMGELATALAPFARTADQRLVELASTAGSSDAIPSARSGPPPSAPVTAGAFETTRKHDGADSVARSRSRLKASAMIAATAAALFAGSVVWVSAWWGAARHVSGAASLSGTVSAPPRAELKQPAPPVPEPQPTSEPTAAKPVVSLDVPARPRPGHRGAQERRATPAPAASSVAAASPTEPPAPSASSAPPPPKKDVTESRE